MVDKGRCQLQVGQVEERTNKGDMPKMRGEAEMSKADYAFVLPQKRPNRA